jgi:hypothetical protein
MLHVDRGKDLTTAGTVTWVFVCAIFAIFLVLDAVKADFVVDVTGKQWNRITRVRITGKENYVALINATDLVQQEGCQWTPPWSSTVVEGGTLEGSKASYDSVAIPFRIREKQGSGTELLLTWYSGNLKKGRVRIYINWDQNTLCFNTRDVSSLDAVTLPPVGHWATLVVSGTAFGTEYGMRTVELFKRKEKQHVTPWSKWTFNTVVGVDATPVSVRCEHLSQCRLAVRDAPHSVEESQRWDVDVAARRAWVALTLADAVRCARVSGEIPQNVADLEMGLIVDTKAPASAEYNSTRLTYRIQWQTLSYELIRTEHRYLPVSKPKGWRTASVPWPLDRWEPTARLPGPKPEEAGSEWEREF